MFPIGDDNPTARPAVLNWSLIGVCALVFLWQSSAGEGGLQRSILTLGMIPAVLTGEAMLAPGLAVVPAWLTIVTAMFPHGGWGHLLGNLLFLWIFGNNIEDRLGRLRYLFFYLACGTAAAFAQIVPAPDSPIPMVGASGAISGVLGAYLVLFPRVQVTVFIPFSFMFIHKIQAFWMLAFWFVLQFVSAAFSTADIGGVAWWAHVGGFLAGAALVWPARHQLRPRLRRPGPWG